MRHIFTKEDFYPLERKELEYDKNEQTQDRDT